MGTSATWEKLYRAVANVERAAGTILHRFVEVTRTIEQEDLEGWLKNRLLGGA